MYAISPSPASAPKNLAPQPRYYVPSLLSNPFEAGALLQRTPSSSSSASAGERQPILSQPPWPAYTTTAFPTSEPEPTPEPEPKSQQDPYVPALCQSPPRSPRGSPPPRRPSDTLCPATGGEHEIRTKTEEMALALADVVFTLVPFGLLLWVPLFLWESGS